MQGQVPQDMGQVAQNQPYQQPYPQQPQPGYQQPYPQQPQQAYQQPYQQAYPQQQYQDPGYQGAPSGFVKGLSIGCMVCGIVSVTLGFFQLFGWPSMFFLVPMILGVGAIVLAVMVRKNGGVNKMRTAGLVCGIIGLCLAGIGMIKFIACACTANSVQNSISGLYDNLYENVYDNIEDSLEDSLGQYGDLFEDMLN